MDAFAVGKKHPFRVRPDWRVHGPGPVAEALVAVQDPIAVKSGFPKTKPAFVGMGATDPQRVRVPVLPVPILEGGSVAGAGDKPTGLEGIGIARRRAVGAQGRVRHIDPIGIDIKFRSRRGVLQIIFPLIFGHPRPFDVGGGAAGAVIFTEALKAVPFRLAPDQPHRGTEGLHGSFFQFNTPNRGGIGAAPEEIQPPVRILK